MKRERALQTFNALLLFIVTTLLLYSARVFGLQNLRNKKTETDKDSKHPEGRNLSNGNIFDRFLMIVLENQNYANVIADPYFQTLIQQGTLFSNFHAVEGFSYPNYIAMVAGSTFGISSNRQIDIQERVLPDLLEAQGLTWKGYAEGYPGDCYMKKRNGSYVKRHVPFLSFTSIQNDPQRCSNVVPAYEFLTDWNNMQIPNFSMYSPDLNNSGHDTGLSYASYWLESFLSPLLADSIRMDRTVIQVVFDEAGKGNGGGEHIFSMFIGSPVAKGLEVSENYNFYSVLRTIEDNFNIGTLGQEDTLATSINGIWVYQLFYNF